MADKKGRPRSHPSSKRNAPRSGSAWLIGIVVVAIVALVVARLISPSSAPSNRGSTSLINKPVSAHLLKTIRTAALATPTDVTNQQPVLPTKGKSVFDPGAAKPDFFYMGGEYCPYCAAERWAFLVALNRFGTFTNLHYMRSAVSDGNIVTFTFYKSHYTSPYLTFSPVEAWSRNQSVPLQAPTNAEYSFFKANDTQNGGTIPFFTVGPYVWVGTQVSPTLLSGLTWTTVASQLSHPVAGTAAGSIMQNANVITAAICATDGGKPTTVCQAPAISSLEPYLPK